MDSMFTRRPNMLKAAHKLHYRTNFQGLPISIENRKGSYRHWYDPHNDEHGKSKMFLPYGYVRGTLGMEAKEGTRDAVDVFIGPNKTSEKVFVIKQMKAPSFVAFDEEKCMVGFNDPKEAKRAYLEHYNDKRFFGGIKVLSMDKFKERLKERKGESLVRSFVDWE